MQLRYRNAEGTEVIVQLGDEPMVIGRSAEANITLLDEKASRRHCEVRLWAGDYVLKDLGAQNGTLLNGAEAKVAVLSPNDQIKVGSITIFFEEKAPVGHTTAMREIEQEMEVGKGYRTILRQIVSDSNPPRKTEGK